MKKIVVPTDFSSAAYNAARYAVNIAQHIKANIEFCHAMVVPAESPQAARIVWPLQDFTTVKEEVALEFKSLINLLNDEQLGGEAGNNQRPSLSTSSEVGKVVDVIGKLVEAQNVNMIVMGVSGASNLTKFVLGSNSLDMINHANLPVLLVPFDAKFKGVRKIAFATDLTEGDIHILQSLATFARHFDADILITHVTTESMEKNHQQKIDQFLREVTCKINYHKIYYKDVKYKTVHEGLNSLVESAYVDILAMVHRHQSFLTGLFKGSDTEKMVKYRNIPLLVFSEAESARRCY